MQILKHKKLSFLPKTCIFLYISKKSCNFAAQNVNDTVMPKIFEYFGFVFFQMD